MKHQLTVLIVTAILLVLGWTVIEYLLQSQIQYQYSQLSSYPILVYTWNDSLMEQVKLDLQQFDFVANQEIKSSEKAAQELIQKYNLQGVEDILEEKTLPNVLIVTMSGNSRSREQKLQLKDKLSAPPYKDKIMVEYQNDIWNKTFERIDQLNGIHWIVLSFLALVIYLVYVFKRLHYEHRHIRLQHLLKIGDLEAVRTGETFWSYSALLVFAPVTLAWLIYEVLSYSDVLQYDIPWYFFLIQIAVLAVASLTAYPFVQHYRREDSPTQEDE